MPNGAPGFWLTKKSNPVFGGNPLTSTFISSTWPSCFVWTLTCPVALCRQPDGTMSNSILFGPALTCSTGPPRSRPRSRTSASLQQPLMDLHASDGIDECSYVLKQSMKAMTVLLRGNLAFPPDIDTVRRAVPLAAVLVLPRRVRHPFLPPFSLLCNAGRNSDPGRRMFAKCPFSRPAVATPAKLTVTILVTGRDAVYQLCITFR